ncbi:hypothetical protein [Bradyrhizobium sp. JYMT SZCCT0428]|uniref:hypothetical protein n=1 Tax=Bradyrhizobium sp. JYMT SZCCT0428 TaxID=2807673 RepID=UPI001BABCB6A|nr:hypothetical protein [Bradyrhizobium sp. JYMT SZCCT0428]MBR1155893.1 hypothetical protein [Bradyrhizobium sp. JYMT SZCCT0428]
MAGLKSFLLAVAPLLGVTSAALYERQRALVALGALKSAPGRGPGSGVPLTAENFAAILISVLATENLSDVDKRVVSLINAPPVRVNINDYSREWGNTKGQVLVDAVSSALSGKKLKFPAPDGNIFDMPITAIRITRSWRAQLLVNRSTEIEYKAKWSSFQRQPPPISITAEIEGKSLDNLIAFTQGALSQAAEGDDE